MKATATIGLILVIVIFTISYLTIDVAYKATMDSLKVEDTTPSSLEVKENSGQQTEQGYKLQPALNVQEQ